MPQPDSNGKVLLQRTPKGKLPQYFQDPITDRLLSIAITLTEELSVMRDRLDTVERLIEKNNLFEQEEIDQFEITEELNAIRSERREAYISRVFRSLQQELDSLNR